MQPSFFILLSSRLCPQRINNLVMMFVGSSPRSMLIDTIEEKGPQREDTFYSSSMMRNDQHIVPTTPIHRRLTTYPLGGVSHPFIQHLGRECSSYTYENSCSSMICLLQNTEDEFNLDQSPVKPVPKSVRRFGSLTRCKAFRGVKLVEDAKISKRSSSNNSSSSSAIRRSPLSRTVSRWGTTALAAQISSVSIGKDGLENSNSAYNFMESPLFQPIQLVLQRPLFLARHFHERLTQTPRTISSSISIMAVATQTTKDVMTVYLCLAKIRCHRRSPKVPPYPRFPTCRLPLVRGLFYNHIYSI
jgi:hypothetical protein